MFSQTVAAEYEKAGPASNVSGAAPSSRTGRTTGQHRPRLLELKNKFERKHHATSILQHRAFSTKLRSSVVMS